ncbi:DNA methyltransferase [Brachybacterium sp. AOP42-E1-35]|uniref:DNA methyltransferase n=1 Tax=Brachybacterium sp. AOP42-E1-35 TaxID=3457664 RepID=UPI00402AB048
MRHCQTVHITACGCGNFLIIAYRELRALELRIHERLQELDPSRAQLSLDAESRVHVRLSQFYGFELEEWPATIARTAMFLVEHQANQAVNLTLGYAVPMLPLQDSARITVANALQAEWSEVIPPTTSLYIMGNPPFPRNSPCCGVVCGHVDPDLSDVEAGSLVA